MVRGRTSRTVTTALIFGLVLAACGGTSVDVSAFCESFVETEGLVSNGPGDEVAAWGAHVTESLTALEEQAPDEISGAVETIAGTISERPHRWSTRT